MATSAPRWCIVGGGLLGLTLALRLSEAGHAVTLIEAANTLGGLAAPWELDDVTWDRHYHVTLLSDRHLRRILKELDLDRDIRWTITRTGFFAGERVYPMDSAFDYLRFPPLGLIDKVRLALTILYVSRLKDGRRLETLPLGPWLQRLSGRQVFEQIWRPLLRAKLGDNYQVASAAFIWAVIRRLYAARETGLKREMFGYVPGGYARILEQFAAHLQARGVRLELGSPVERIAQGDSGLTVTRAAGAETFDRVVVTLAAPLAGRICVGLSEDEVRRLNGIPYQGIVCPSVVVEQPLSRNYLTYITDERIPFTAVVEMSALVDPAAFGGRGLIYLPRYVTQDDPYWQVPDDEIERRFLDGLGRILPNFRRESVLCFRVSRVRQVLAISTLGYSERLPPMATSVPGLYVVNSAHIVNGTLNVNETVALAESVVPMLLAQAGGAGTAPARLETVG